MTETTTTQGLYDYETGEYLREATAEEVAESDKAAESDGGVGAFRSDEYGRSCYTA